jgi:hypothetical protein
MGGLYYKVFEDKEHIARRMALPRIKKLNFFDQAQ